MSKPSRALLAVCAVLVPQVAVTDELDRFVESTSAPQRIIVLRNGRVISGDLEDRPGGYLVNNSVGSVVIPFTHVRLTAQDLPEAYRKLKESITEPTASAHVSLGQWCYDNRLYTSAREQVKAALLLEPERKEARTLLKQIERVTAGDAFDATLPAPPRKMRDGFMTSPTQSLSGLPPSVTQEFVRKIQPLLMNKCGNARCHGAAGSSDFRLTRVWHGMSGYRTLTGQNLAAVLRMIDPQQPRTSPLLVIPHGEHGRKGPVWSGPRADEQLAELRAWVIRVANERSPISTVSGAVAAAAGGAASASGTNATGKRDPFLGEILAAERPDQFDPAIFNRLVHGRE